MMVAVKTSDAHLINITDPKIDVVDSNVDSVLVDTGTTIPATITTLQGDVTAVKAITDVIPDAGAMTSIAQEATLNTVDGHHGVPLQNAADNNVMSDVIGNKTDTPGGGSLYSKSVSIQNTLQFALFCIGISEGTDPITLPQTGQSSIFSVTGVIEIVNFMGFVTAQIGAVANNMKVIANSTAGTDVDLCATVDVNADNVGTIYSLTGTLANAMVKTAGNGAGNTGAFESQATGITVTAGTIDIHCDANDGGGGRVQWIVIWKRVSPDGALLPV